VTLRTEAPVFDPPVRRSGAPPARRSFFPDPSTDVPTAKRKVPSDVLSMLRTMGQDEEPTPTGRRSELHDTDECPIADLSDADDLEWID
jgi:hypothetical protein